MQQRRRVAVPMIACSMSLMAAATYVGLAPVGDVAAAVVGGPVLALAPGNTLVGFAADDPGTITRTTTITGLLDGETMVGFDVRPASGETFAVGVNGSSAHLYVLNTSNGVATPVNPTPFSVTLPVGGTWSVDFNPVVDRLRFVHSSGASYRINQLTGTLAATDSTVAPGVPVAVAYDRSTSTAPSATTLFAIDATTSSLQIIGGVDGMPSPNLGTTTARGALGVTLDAPAVGFDIAPAGDALAALSVAGDVGLYTIDLASGAATSVGDIGDGSTIVLDIALPRPPAGQLVGLVDDGRIIRFDAGSPAAIGASTEVTGLGAGERLVGLDVRPATGELFAVSVSGTTGRVYRVDPATGGAVKIGSTPFATDLPAAGTWSVDVNPTVDRIRLVHSTGASYRVNPLNGALVAADTAIAPASPTAVSYDRSVAGTTATTLYAIDATTSTLHLIGSPDGAPVSPNAGTTTLRGSLGVTLSSAEVGFDVTPVGEAVATLEVGGTTNLYALDLVTGRASLIEAVGAGDVDLVDLVALPKVAAGASQFSSVTPTRVLDTRQTGVKPAADSSLDVAVAGVAGVPSNATAVVLNLTGTDASANGFITVHPAGTARPVASNNNLVAGGTRATLVTTKLGVDGAVSIYVQGGAHLVVDVMGYYAPATGTAGRFTAVAPARVFDTREGAGVAPAAGTSIVVDVTGAGGVPTTGVSAVVVNLTATQAAGPGFLRAFATGMTPPITSNLNLQRVGATASNLAIVPVGADGTITVFTQQGAHVVVDVAGWFGDSSAKGGYRGLFVPLAPNRVLDTRAGVGAPTAPVSAASSIDIAIGGVGGVPAAGASSVLLTLTSVESPSAGFVTAYPTGSPRALVASLNVDTAGEVVPNLVASPLGTNGRVTVFTQAGGHFVADVAGWFTA